MKVKSLSLCSVGPWKKLSHRSNPGRLGARRRHAQGGCFQSSIGVEEVGAPSVALKALVDDGQGCSDRCLLCVLPACFDKLHLLDVGSLKRTQSLEVFAR